MNTNRLVEWLRFRGVVAASEVRAGLRVSAAGLAYLYREAGPAVVRLGRARATRYALSTNIANLESSVPIYRISNRGQPQLVATLLTLDGGASCIRHVAGRDAIHEGLPPAVQDMAPAGYLGRRFAQHHAELGLPGRLQDWNDGHRLLAIARRGEDLPGDLVLGEESLDRFLAKDTVSVTREDYPELTRLVAESGAGSSAAGEQPKFTAHVDGQHRIVKFSVGDRSPTDVRWRDLLVCESLASDTLAHSSVATAESSVVDVGGRRFLEVTRFDRIGERGRRGVLSLGAIDDEWFGLRDSWTQAAQRLEREGLLSAEDRHRTLLLEAFGVLIHNVDRHFGNLSFVADELATRPQLELAPSYDMLPMGLAPHAGVVPVLTLEAPRLRASLIEVWPEASELARRFWAAVGDDSRVSDEFRAAARGRAQG